MKNKVKLLIPSAILAGLLMPITGLGGILHLVFASIHIRKGENVRGERSIRMATYWIQASIYMALAVITIFAILVFFMGGKLIPVLGSFY